MSARRVRTQDFDLSLARARVTFSTWRGREDTRQRANETLMLHPARPRVEIVAGAHEGMMTNAETHRGSLRRPRPDLCGRVRFSASKTW
jgi:hypothetical protein